MSSACGIRRAWTTAVTACGLLALCAAMAAAHAPAWSVPNYGLYPGATAGGIQPNSRLGISGPGFVMGNPADVAPTRAPQQSPMARVVRNPDESSGLPPYALTDNAGTIQRYVESVPGIDMEPYVGMVVRVRHDTGRTLLASQLELPPQPLRPVVEASDGDDMLQLEVGKITPIKLAARPSSRANVVRPAEFMDDDDATVQLLADAEEVLPDGGEITTSPSAGDTPPAAPQNGESSYPTFPDGMSMEGGPMYGEPIEMGAGPTGMGGPMMEMGMPGMGYGEVMEGSMEVCPQCGGHHLPPSYDGMPGAVGGPTCQRNEQRTHWFADVQFNFLRAHVMENLAGKLSEKYEFSPRVIVGFDGTGIVDGRARYWHYGRNTQVLNSTDSVRFEFDVLDLEATRTVSFGKSAVLVAAGLRSANIHLVDDDEDSAGCDLLGMTAAADFRTLVCPVQRGEIVAVCGARLSILGGDWGQSGGSDFIPGQLQDDNWVVDELYAGVAYATLYRKLSVHAQLGFEMQNWHSDALAQFAGGDSITFLGPGIEIGAEF